MIERDPFFAALRQLPLTRPLPTCFADAILHLPPGTLDHERRVSGQGPQITTIDGNQCYTAGDLVQGVLDDLIQQGQKPIRHSSFENFLADGFLDDVWIFGMVLLDFNGQKRPVDVLACLELSAQQCRHAHVEQLNLAEYTARMMRYMERFQEQHDAEELAKSRMEQAMRPGHRISTDKDGKDNLSSRRKSRT